MGKRLYLISSKSNILKKNKLKGEKYEYIC